MMKLISVRQNLHNYQDLRIRGFKVTINDACTRLLVTLAGTMDAVQNEVADALGIMPEALSLTSRGGDEWLVQPVEVE
jgi:hypothetical protein